MSRDEGMKWFAASVTILVLMAGGWLYREWGAVRAAPVVQPEPATVARTDAGPIVSRDSVLSNARYVVNDWREADEVMTIHSDAEIKAMLATNKIIVVMPPCKDGHPWIDQTKVLTRYSCEGPMP